MDDSRIQGCVALPGPVVDHLNWNALASGFHMSTVAEFTKPYTRNTPMGHMWKLPTPKPMGTGAPPLSVPLGVVVFTT